MFTFFHDIRRIADALDRAFPGTPTPADTTITGEPTVSYYSDEQAAALAELDRQREHGTLSAEAADEIEHELTRAAEEAPHDV